MDINPLTVDLIKYKEELLDQIENAIHYNELNISDEYVACGIAEIKTGKVSDNPFQQLANLYSLPLEEVVSNIRDFTNKAYETDIMGDFVDKDIDFESMVKM